MRERWSEGVPGLSSNGTPSTLTVDRRATIG
jgi:hypothetical protein